jgi:glyoxylase-like metal-dependent hydrolase (beta-lactamase superfamily II)
VAVATDLNLCHDCTEPLQAGHALAELPMTQLPLAVIEISSPVAQPQPLAHPLSDNVFLFEDTCHVYLVRSGREAIAIDFGSGDVLDELPSLGIDRLTDVLVTHHHRDQGQGLHRAIEADIRVWVPDSERDLFTAVGEHWQARTLANNYNNRQDRFSLLEDVSASGTLTDYSVFTAGGRSLKVVPTPGHTPGSISILAELDGKRFAFTGDLMAAPGKVWSLAATQWSYNGSEGVFATVASLLDLKDRQPEVLLPSHGEVMTDPVSAIDQTVERLERLLELRREEGGIAELRATPYEAVRPHLLRNRTSHGTTYALVSRSRKALLIDFGYDFTRGLAAGTDRAARRPWLYTIDRLKRDFGIEAIEAVVPTHYHDDHVAGCNLLRSVEGTQVWAAETIADVLERPEQYDLPCLWYDPVAVDRRLPLDTAIAWEEYQLVLHNQPGHTRYAVAIETTVDDTHVLFIGDQMGHEDGLGLNYVYAGGFAADDYAHTAALYQRIQPDLLLTGHWGAVVSEPNRLATIAARSHALAQLHRELLPLQTIDLEASGPLATVRPYRIRAKAGAPFSLTVEVRNPVAVSQEIRARLVAPPGWLVEPGQGTVFLPSAGKATLEFSAIAPVGTVARRARIGVEVAVGARRLGQLVEALVDVS